MIELEEVAYFDSYEVSEQHEIDRIVLNATHEMNGFDWQATKFAMEYRKQSFIVWLLEDIDKKGRAW